jgi:predicted NBD/HSP70 family sugar kinase
MTGRIGIDLGGTKIEGVVIDAAGALLARERVATPRDRYDDTVAAVAGLVTRLERDVTGRCTVGIGMPGAISAPRSAGRCGSPTTPTASPSRKPPTAPPLAPRPSSA